MSVTDDGNGSGEKKNSPVQPYLLLSFQSSLRLRHLTQVVGCNLEGRLGEPEPHPPCPLPSLCALPDLHVGYYVTIEASGQGPVLYSTNVVPSANPVWDSFDPSHVIPLRYQSLQGAIIRVWFSGMKGSNRVTSWGLNFSGLYPIGRELPTWKSSLPSNAVILRLRGMYYTAPDCISYLKEEVPGVSRPLLHHVLSMPLSATKPSYAVPSLSRLHSTKRAQRQLERRCEEIRNVLVHKGVCTDSHIVALRTKVENMRTQVSLVMEQLKNELNKLRGLKKAIDDLESTNQDKGLELLQLYQTLNRKLSRMRSQEGRLQEQNKELKELCARVQERQCQLLSQLQLIFPVTQEKLENESSMLSICGIHLPDAEHYDGVPEQSLGVGLGYVAQLLVEMSNLINIPLRYPVTPFGSLSTIKDHTSTQLQGMETEFPLFPHGREREKLRFHYGVFLLNKNIAQLRWYMEIPTPDLRITLANLWHLFYYFRMPSQIFMPDVQRPIVSLPVWLQSAPQTESLPNTKVSPSHVYILKYPSNEGENKSLSGVDSGDRSLSESEAEHTATTDSQKTSMPMLSTGKTLVQTVSSSLGMSVSLDKGLNQLDKTALHQLLSGNDALCERSFTQRSLPHATSSDPNMFLNLERKVASLGTIPVEGGIPEFVDHQTTKLLESWHRDEPSHYTESLTEFKGHDEDGLPEDKSEDAISTLEIGEHMLLNGNIPEEELVCPDRSAFTSEQNSEREGDSETAPDELVLDGPPLVCKQELSGVNDICLEVTSVEETSAHESTVATEAASELLEHELKKSLLEVDPSLNLNSMGLMEELFINDMSYRTAALANKKCSFKFTK